VNTTSSRQLPTGVFTPPTRRNWTRCWQICSDSSKLSPTSCEFRTYRRRDSTRQLRRVGVGVGRLYSALPTCDRYNDNVPDNRSTHDDPNRLNVGPQAVGFNPVHRRRRIVRGLDGDGGGALVDDDRVEEEYLDVEEMDGLGALRSDAAAPAGGMLLGGLSVGRSRYHTGRDASATDSVTMTTTSTTSITQPSRRLTLPSIVKYQEVANASSTAASSNTRHTGTASVYHRTLFTDKR